MISLKIFMNFELKNTYISVTSIDQNFSVIFVNNFFLPNFLSQIVLITHSRKIPQGAKFPNTPKLYTTNHTIRGTFKALPMWQHYISSTRFLLEAINNYLAFFFVTSGLFRDFLEFIYVIYHRTRYHAVIICKGVYQIAEWEWNYFEVPKRKNFFNIQVLLGGNLTLHIPFSLQKIIFLSPSVRLRR